MERRGKMGGIENINTVFGSQSFSSLPPLHVCVVSLRILDEITLHIRSYLLVGLGWLYLSLSN